LHNICLEEQTTKSRIIGGQRCRKRRANLTLRLVVRSFLMLLGVFGCRDCLKKWSRLLILLPRQHLTHNHKLIMESGLHRPIPQFLVHCQRCCVLQKANWHTIQILAVKIQVQSQALMFFLQIPIQSHRSLKFLKTQLVRLSMVILSTTT